jgi:hypothetical protein
MAAFDMVHVVPSSVTFVERIESLQRILKEVFQGFKSTTDGTDIPTQSVSIKTECGRFLPL